MASSSSSSSSGILHANDVTLKIVDPEKTLIVSKVLVRRTAPPILIPSYVFFRQVTKVYEHAQAMIEGNQAEDASSGDYPIISLRFKRIQGVVEVNLIPAHRVLSLRDIHMKSNSTIDYDTEYIEYSLVNTLVQNSTDTIEIRFNDRIFFANVDLKRGAGYYNKYCSPVFVTDTQCLSLIVYASQGQSDSDFRIHSMGVIIDKYDYANKSSYLIPIGRSLVYKDQRTPYYNLTTQTRKLLEQTDAELTHVVLRRYNQVLAGALHVWRCDVPLLFNVEEEDEGQQSEYSRWDNSVANLRVSGEWSVYDYVSSIDVPRESNESELRCLFRFWTKSEHLDEDHVTKGVSIQNFPSYDALQAEYSTLLEMTRIVVLEHSSRGQAYSIFRFSPGVLGKAVVSVLFHKLNSTRHLMNSEFLFKEDETQLLEQLEINTSSILDHVDIAVSRILHPKSQATSASGSFYIQPRETHVSERNDEESQSSDSGSEDAEIIEYEEV